ncbi:MAG: hypothetical protein DHS20C15_03230 [Planctomycetota bacterium]|nr:MAG: hypothetical protein DHS20C15_03230 [Planctomycetota bacterium]
MRSTKLSYIVLLAAFTIAPSKIVAQSSPILELATVGSGVTDIADSNLDVATRFTYEADAADLDADGDSDLLWGNMAILADGSGGWAYSLIEGSQGLQLLWNRTDDSICEPGTLCDPCAAPSPALYELAPATFFEAEAGTISWINNEAPSVRDTEVGDVDDDGVVDIYVSAGIGVDPDDIEDVWTSDESALTQNRILMGNVTSLSCGESRTWTDDSFGADQALGGTASNADRLPLSSVNSCGVAMHDLDNDGDLDIVVGNYGPEFTAAVNTVLLNDGTGHFSVMSNPFSAKPNGGASADVEIGDIDGDTHLDIVVANANPYRHHVVDSGYSLVDALAAPHRNEVWVSRLGETPPVFGWTLLPVADLPDPPGQPSVSLDPPYNDHGFWNDTRSVSLSDIDLDGDLDIAFANNGWAESRPDFRIHPRSELPGQASQLLLNMGNLQTHYNGGSGAATGYGLNEYLDVSYAIPYGLHAGPAALFLRWRALLDLEFTPAGASAADIDEYYEASPSRSDPTPDDYPDLAVAAGPMARNSVLVNNADWQMVSSGLGALTKGRFYRGEWRIDSSAGPFPSAFDPPLPNVSDELSTSGPLGFNRNVTLYTHDIDWADLDGDGRLDLFTADGDSRRGEVNSLYLYRGHTAGFRWSGPSDEGALLPFRNSVLAYGISTGDLEGDGDLDVVLAGVPTALIYQNQRIGQVGDGPVFEEATFTERSGLLPFTSQNSLFAPLLTESVVLFDADGDGDQDMIIGGYPAYADNGIPHHSKNEALHWYYPNDDYYSPLDAPVGSGSSVAPQTHHYLIQGMSGEFSDVTLDDDGGTPWLDLGDRIHNTIPDRLRAGDLDNDGHEDVVVGYRLVDEILYPHMFAGSTFDIEEIDPADWQLAIGLWFNDGLGHLVDRTIDALGAWNDTSPPDPDDLWNQVREDRYEGIAIVDVEGDGDLDLVMGGHSNAGGSGENRWFINMGGAQKDIGGAYNWHTGQFQIAGLEGGALEDWDLSSGMAPLPRYGGWVEPTDIDGDGDIDFILSAALNEFDSDAVASSLMGATYSWGTYLLLAEPGDSTSPMQYVTSDFAGTALDQFINTSTTDGTTPVSGETHFFGTGVPGDFNADGLLDVLLVGNEAAVHRLLVNTSSVDMDGEITTLSFEDRTAKDSNNADGDPDGWGDAEEDGITWVEGWSGPAAVGDFDGDGVHDAIVTNYEQGAQSDLFLSSSETPGGPWISGIDPPGGAISGRIITLRGAGLSGVNSLEVFNDASYSGSGVIVSASANKVRLRMPSTAPLGNLQMRLSNGSADSNEITYSHLYARPKVSVQFTGVPKVVIEVSDKDGFSDLDIMDNPDGGFRIEFIRGGSTIASWNDECVWGMYPSETPVWSTQYSELADGTAVCTITSTGSTAGGCSPIEFGSSSGQLDSGDTVRVTLRDENGALTIVEAIRP